ncbi:PDZ domain-containing protein [bacterium]|nr:MAG: PDZ domain-containing protein [bacterium]
MKFLSKYSDQSLRFLILLITVYCALISGIPLFRAAFTDRLTFDDSIKDFKQNADYSGLKVVSLRPGGVSEKAGILQEDIILAVNGIAVNDIREFNHELSKNPEGVTAVYTIERNGITFLAYVEVYRYFHLIFFVFSALAFGFLINGFIVGYSQPRDLVSQIFFLLGTSASIGFNYFGGVWYYTGVLNFLYYNYTFGLSLFYPLFFHFFSLYPNKYEFRGRKITLGAIYLYSVLLISVLPLLPIHITDESILYWVQLISLSPALILFGAIILFLVSYRKTNSILKKSLRIIVIGFILGGTGLIYYFFIFTPLIASGYRSMNILYRVPIILVLTIPISIGISILKYRILDTEYIVKKGITFGFLAFLVSAVYLGIAYLLDTFVLSGFRGNRMLLTIAVMYLFIFTFSHLIKQIRRFIDKRFYKERYNYRKALLKFSEELPFINNLRDVIEKLDFTIKETMGISKVYVWIYDREFLRIVREYFNIKEKFVETKLTFRDEVYSGLYRTDNNLKFLYPINLTEIDLPETHKDFIRNDKIVMSVPICIKNKLIGAINFGEKPGGKTYSDEDVDLLKTLASQTSIVFENTRLKIEEMNMKIIESELQVARNIQLGLLPKVSSPEGLEISCYTCPARVIGGDFYDFIRIDEKRVLVVIADVSGKGIPAALYMAKVQAILRFASKIFKNPKDILNELNKQVFKKLDRNSYVTMILALFDTEQGKVRITRAGHNPVIYSNNGDLKMLKSKGIGIGLEGEKIFSENLEEVELDSAKNNFFLFYTDGLNEAMNTKREEFGIERILKIVNTNRYESPLIIQNRLVSEVENFRETADQNDDISIVVVKVK